MVFPGAVRLDHAVDPAWFRDVQVDAVERAMTLAEGTGDPAGPNGQQSAHRFKAGEYP